MAAPQISVIIPVYNRAHTIGVAIRSVLHQTERDFELIVVDDASADRTRNVVREFHDARVSLLEHSRNAGSSVARNTGIKAARGRYIAFLDSDDLWFPKMLESQLALLKSAPQQVGGVVSDYVITDEDRNPRYVRRNATSSRSPDELILIGHGIGMGQSLVVPRGVFDDVGVFDPGYPRAQDWEWLLRFRQRHKMFINPQILFAYQESNYSKPEVIRSCLQKIGERHSSVIAQRDGAALHRKFTAALNWKLARTEIAQRHWAKGADRLLQSAGNSAGELAHYGARLLRDRLRVLVGRPQGFDPGNLTLPLQM